MSHREEQMRELVTAQALEWFVAQRCGPLCEARRQDFIDWLRASPAHAREYLALTGFVGDLGQVAKGFSTPAETLVARARAEIDAVQPLFPKPDGVSEQHSAAPPRNVSRRRVWTAVAAAVLAVATVVPLSVWWLQDRTAYSTAHAEQRSRRMPDGSTVHLNSNSEIRVKFDAERREVELIRGQALFQVAKDPRRPFWVHAGDAVVKAVGTEFDVYRQPQRTVISVVEGRVAVWHLQDDSSGEVSSVIEPVGRAAQPEPIAHLDAGQQARITREAAVVSKRADDVRKTVAWLRRQVVFDHDQLGSAVEEFNRYAQLSIRIDDPALRAAEISGVFSAYDVESFIRFLEHQPEMRVERAGDEIVVTAAHTPQ